MKLKGGACPERSRETLLSLSLSLSLDWPRG